jgi:hypothetical protein
MSDDPRVFRSVESGAVSPLKHAKRVPSDLVADFRRRAMKSPKDISRQAMGLADILTTLRDSRTKQRRAFSRHISDAMPADMVARAVAAVERNGDDITELYWIFRNWIDQETEKIRIKYTACVRCTEPTRGAVAIAGIGWLCSAHFRSEEIHTPQREPRKPLDPATAVLGASRKAP